MIKNFFKTAKKSFSKRYVSTIGKEIINIIESKKQSIKNFENLKGGLERWLQGEIILGLLGKFHQLKVNQTLFQESRMNYSENF
jgi:hypothetical protein